MKMTASRSQELTPATLVTTARDIGLSDSQIAKLLELFDPDHGNHNGKAGDQDRPSPPCEAKRHHILYAQWGG